MLKRPPSTENLAAVRRLKGWTRKRFALDGDIVVFVAEHACGLPGCPPLETIVTFWTTPDTRHEYKLFKRVDEVVEEDLPPSWMKSALIVDGTGPACC